MPSGWAERVRALARDGAARAQGGALHIWRRLFGGTPRGWFWSWLLVAGIAIVVGSSTAGADWVPGSDVLGGPAAWGALLAGALALVRPLPWPAGLAATLAAGVLEALSSAGSGGLGDGLSALLAGDYSRAGSALLFLLALLVWSVGAWLAFAVLRWRRVLLGLVPAIAVVATNVLNFPLQQSGSTFALVALSVLLLLWTSYAGRLESARRGGLRLSPDSRFDFWQSGLVAGAALVLVAFVAPPLSTVDRTVDAQTGIIKTWSDIQIRLHHQLPGGALPGATYSTGFSDQVQLGHPLQRNSTVVFTYQVVGSHAVSVYFRGLDLPATLDGSWQTEQALHISGFLPGGVAPPYDETYQAQQSVTVKVRMQRPPALNQNLYFYPGRFESIDKQVYYEQRGAPLLFVQNGRAVIPSAPPVERPIPLRVGLEAIDKLTTLSGRPTTGAYSATGDYSTASIDQLRAAGTDYPAWIGPYTTFASWGPLGTYRSPPVLDQIKQLAVQVTAGAANPYDKATAIESYLRSSAFTYTLKPPSAESGEDQLAFFLFSSHKGYCEYFATAMGDMLRSLGIPTRLVNGYGPGSFDQKTQRFVVRELDAHTWVEAYFPGLGWIPFEPTPDGTYFPVPRGQAACHTDSAICQGLLGAAGTVVGTTGKSHFDDTISTQQSELPPIQPQRKLPFDPVRVALLALSLLLLVALLLAARFLTPRTPSAAWRRTRQLGRLAGVPERPGETPLEFGRRLAKALPRAATDAGRLASGFAVSAYAPPELARAGADDVLAGWRGLRPVLLRETAARAAGRRPAR